MAFGFILLKPKLTIDIWCFSQMWCVQMDFKEIVFSLSLPLSLVLRIRPFSSLSFLLSALKSFRKMRPVRLLFLFSALRFKSVRFIKDTPGISWASRVERAHSVDGTGSNDMMNVLPTEFPNYSFFIQLFVLSEFKIFLLVAFAMHWVLFACYSRTVTYSFLFHFF